ncbi:non-canonical purine NTP pyrophosphatase, rdgB/HAM1 family [Thermosinus carboxydivorans Nor1]|uniref:dITP/XTP pyrophosphatase n=1 Tax=Thermosinus carboxydivorans Nor1 TaxID=401526 RepID=A1HQF7_9FIRM|nr:non-canonical purine NTP pyrophosphatase, rdgB/HAM1 family [Thermosinus carboxydivorans Nor1]
MESGAGAVKEIVVATRNAGKVAEITAALADLPVTLRSLRDFGAVPDAVEDGDTFEANAVLKAKHYARYTGMACLADDSGLEVDALGGAPGVFSARYAGEGAGDAANNAKLLRELAGVPAHRRSARFRCVLAFLDEDGTLLVTEGTCEGIILEQPRGTGGFGYDPLLYLPELGKTVAELTIAEKNAVSHRGKALRQMAAMLAERQR